MQLIKTIITKEVLKTSNYLNHEDCAMGKTFKRVFNTTKGVSVGGTEVTLDRVVYKMSASLAVELSSRCYWCYGSDKTLKPSKKEATDIHIVIDLKNKTINLK